MSCLCFATDKYLMYIEEAKCRQVYASVTEYHANYGGVHYASVWRMHARQ